MEYKVIEGYCLLDLSINWDAVQECLILLTWMGSKDLYRAHILSAYVLTELIKMQVLYEVCLINCWD